MSRFEFCGEWKSQYYSNINGRVNIELPFYPTDEFDTILVLTYDDNSTYRPGEEASFSMSGSLGDAGDADGRLVYLLRPADTSAQLFTISLYSDDTWSWKGVYACVHPVDVGNMIIKSTVTCWGCIEDQLNQLAHMAPGGCLYMESDLDVDF